MPIRMAPLGEEVEIKRVSMDEEVKRRLESMGIVVGQRVTVLANDGGALVLKVKDCKVAIDERMASGIFIACL